MLILWPTAAVSLSCQRWLSCFLIWTLNDFPVLKIGLKPLINIHRVFTECHKMQSLTITSFAISYTYIKKQIMLILAFNRFHIHAPAKIKSFYKSWQSWRRYYNYRNINTLYKIAMFVVHVFVCLFLGFLSFNIFCHIPARTPACFPWYLTSNNYEFLHLSDQLLILHVFW